MKILKAVLLISAFLAVVLRLFTYENVAVISEGTLKVANIAAFVSAGVCVITALIWAVILKKEEKKNKEKEKTDEEKDG